MWNSSYIYKEGDNKVVKENHISSDCLFYFPFVPFLCPLFSSPIFCGSFVRLRTNRRPNLRWSEQRRRKRNGENSRPSLKWKNRRQLLKWKNSRPSLKQKNSRPSPKRKNSKIYEETTIGCQVAWLNSLNGLKPKMLSVADCKTLHITTTKTNFKLFFSFSSSKLDCIFSVVWVVCLPLSTFLTPPPPIHPPPPFCNQAHSFLAQATCLSV